MPALWEQFLYQEIFRHVLQTNAPYQQQEFPVAVNAADPDFRQNMARQSRKFIEAINGINSTQT